MKPCGHSACSQHYIDTGSRECIDDDVAVERERVRLEAQRAAIADGDVAAALAWEKSNLSRDVTLLRFQMQVDVGSKRASVCTLITSSSGGERVTVFLDGRSIASVPL